MSLLPLYKIPLPTAQEPQFSIEKWEEAVELYNNNKHRESVIKVLEYLNKDLLKGKNLDKDIHINKIHGLVEVTIDINRQNFSIETKLVDIDKDCNKIALLRKVAELNFHYNNLAYLVYENNKIYYKYIEPLELCEPNKLYHTIRDIVFSSDKYANEFIEYYNAKPIDSFKKKRLNSNDEKEALSQIKDYLNEYSQYVEYFTTHNLENYIWDISVITLIKLSNMTYLNGIFRDELMIHISALYDDELNFGYRIDIAKKYINSLQKIDINKFKDALYYREDIFSMLMYPSNYHIHKKLKDYEETLNKYQNEGNHFAISYYLMELFLNLIYRYNLNKKHKKLIHKTLLQTSKANTKDASKELIKLYNKLQNINFEENSKTTLFETLIDYWWVLILIYIIFSR